MKASGLLESITGWFVSEFFWGEWLPPILRKGPASHETRAALGARWARGTRGDVQPFVALARGLILQHNCISVCWGQNGTWKLGGLGVPVGRSCCWKRGTEVN